MQWFDAAMNQQFRSPQLSRTAEAAEGLERCRRSVAEIEEMTEAYACSILAQQETF